MNLHSQIMNIQIDRVRMLDQLNFVSDYNTAYKLGHRDARHAAAELSLKAEARIDELEKRLRREEEGHGNTINQRDQAEAYADMLSGAIGNHFRVEVGEHSNMNCPWFEAEKVMNGEYITDSDEEHEISRLKNENEKYNQRYLNDLNLFGKCQEKEDYQQQRIEELEQEDVKLKRDVKEIEREYLNSDVCFNAVIDYILNKGYTESPLEFLRCWNEGDFDSLREEWPDAPEEIYLADPLYKGKK